MMRMLAVDTSTKYLSIAFFEDDNVISTYHEDEGIRHSEVLLPRINGMLDEAGIGIRDIDVIAVGTGPGSFTGLRILVSIVKGLAVGAGLKVAGIPTLDAIVINAMRLVDKYGAGTGYMPVLDARKNKVYSCRYEYSDGKFNRSMDYKLFSVTELIEQNKDDIVVFGDGIEIYEDELEAQKNIHVIKDLDWYPKAVDIGSLALRRIKKGYDDAATLEPLYLFPEDCNIIKK